MSLSKKEYEQILDDLKILARLEKVVREEDNTEKRKFASLIVEDMMNKLCSDIYEMYEFKFKEE